MFTYYGSMIKLYQSSRQSPLGPGYVRRNAHGFRRNGITIRAWILHAIKYRAPMVQFVGRGSHAAQMGFCTECFDSRQQSCQKQDLGADVEQSAFMTSIAPL